MIGEIIQHVRRFLLQSLILALRFRFVETAYQQGRQPMIHLLIAGIGLLSIFATYLVIRAI